MQLRVYQGKKVFVKVFVIADGGIVECKYTTRLTLDTQLCRT